MHLGVLDHKSNYNPSWFGAGEVSPPAVHKEVVMHLTWFGNSKIIRRIHTKNLVSAITT